MAHSSLPGCCQVFLDHCLLLVPQADSNKGLKLLHPSSSSLRSLGSFEQVSVGKHCYSKEVALAVEEVVEAVAFSLVLAGVGLEVLLGEAWMRQKKEVGGLPLLPMLERQVEKRSCCVAGDELGRQAGLREG